MTQRKSHLTSRSLKRVIVEIWLRFYGERTTNKEAGKRSNLDFNSWSKYPLLQLNNNFRRQQFKSFTLTAIKWPQDVKIRGLPFGIAAENDIKINFGLWKKTFCERV